MKHVAAAHTGRLYRSQTWRMSKHAPRNADDDHESKVAGVMRACMKTPDEAVLLCVPRSSSAVTRLAQRGVENT
ncbi:hypothetical protein E2C01_055478 [Portunus trituberculatus]|uniref:Uncharacterized protein n=1 Tax=Portunus trituberculatus TaxID=210409 RepID=A0A5B7GUW4_PORTR|nr:hypothetical protein [Portunus trituberculatus]